MGVLPKPMVHRLAIEAMQEEPLLPRLQLLEAVIERLDVPRVEVFPQPLEQFFDSPRRGRAPLQKGLGPPQSSGGPAQQPPTQTG